VQVTTTGIEDVQGDINAISAEAAIMIPVQSDGIETL